MFWINILGYCAGILTLFNMLPQAIKTYKTKSVKDVSFLMVISYALSMLLWVAYAYFIKSMPIVITNGIAFLISSIQLILMIRYKRE
jgi:MtN3 and saliva related transmembrane protein